MSKVTTVDEVKKFFRDGMTIMIGGFGVTGQPLALTEALLESGVKDLITISNDNARLDRGMGKLITEKRIKKTITSHIGGNKESQRLMLAGELEVALVPQGTLAERVRAGGYGLGGFYTPTGVGTEVAVGKETKVINGKEYLLELPLRAELALIRASIADEVGNLYYNYSTRNHNPLMAMAADIVIVAAEKIVPVGSINPSDVHTPHCVVDYIVQEIPRPF